MMIDERFSVVEDAICDAFFQLLKKKEMEKITVADVVNRAGIVRSTFYNHYENIPALIQGIEDRTISDIFSMLETFHPKNDYTLCFSFYKSICEYVKNNQLVIQLLQRPEGNAFFEKVLTMFHKYVRTLSQNKDDANKNSSVHTPKETTPSKEEFSYLIAAIIGETVGVLHKWTLDDCNPSTDFVAKILAKGLLSYNLLG